MPTGYTYDLMENEDMTAEDFLRSCAFAFGAAMHVRDEKKDSKSIPKREFPTKDAIKEKEADLEKLQLRKDETWEKNLKTSNEFIAKRRKEDLEKKKEQRQRFLKVKEQINDWSVPSGEHLNLKDFALQQLDSTLGWDLTITERDMPEENTMSVEEYTQMSIKEAERRLEFEKEQYEQEYRRVQEQHEWVDALEESLKNFSGNK